MTETLPYVVALEADEEKMYLYFHDGEKFRCEERPFSPWFVAAEQLEGAVELKGSQVLRYRVPGSDIPKGAAVCNFKDKRSAAMIDSGIRLFGGMSFQQLRRMQFQVDASDGTVEKICCADNTGWYEEFSGADEAALIKGFVEAVCERDPDVIEGYDFFRNDWEILKKAASRKKVKLLCGRDGSAVSSSRSSVVIGERRLSYTKFECHGRHLIDVFLMLQLHDVARRELESYDLEYAAEFFELHSDKKVLQIGALSALLTPAYFYCTNFIPASFQDVALRGNGSKIDLLLTGAYLEQNHSLPLPEPSVFFPGATSKAELSGLFFPVWHCDVRSLYPSILLAENLVPSRDELQLFPALLRELRQKRLEAKDNAKRQSAQKEHWNAMQSALKIVINSFYGYLGFAQGSFNDFALAAQVTARGREILSQMSRFLSDSGARIIEMDTDGIYFTPPEGEEPETLEEKIQQVLPEGITVELDAVFPAMYSYKAKNYALLTADGEVKLTGAALKSRGMERFFRQVVKEILRLKLTRQEEQLPAYHESCRQALSSHSVPLADLCKNETLNDTPANYKKKLESGSSRRSAVYELLLKAGLPGRVGDKVEYYITGTKTKPSVTDNSKLLSANQGERDENLPCYLAKLDELFSTFAG